MGSDWDLTDFEVPIVVFVAFMLLVCGIVKAGELRGHWRVLSPFPRCAFH